MEVFLTQQTIQMAVSTMNQEDIEKEYGPIQIVNSIDQALKDPSLTKRDWSAKQQLYSQVDALMLL